MQGKEYHKQVILKTTFMCNTFVQETYPRSQAKKGDSLLHFITHIQAQAFSKLPRPLFWVDMALVCYLCHFSQLYMYSCPCTTSQFLESVMTTRTIMMLA